MKYIVYKTTNVTNGFFYIGVHQTENPEVFDGYLGCGINIHKSTTYEKAKTCLQQAVKQFGPKSFKRETLAIFETKEEAYALEGMMVNEEFLARQDVYNMILGGIVNNVQGRTVYRYSADTGEFIDEFASISAAASKVESFSSTICHSIKLKFQIKGFCFSFDKTDKIDLSEYNFKINIPVYRYLNSGELDKEYDSLDAAGKDTFGTSTAYIQKAARLGYKVKDTYYFCFIKADNYDKARTKAIALRPVFKYDSEGQFMQEYETQKAAELDNQYCNITNSIKLRQPDINGCYWSLDLVPIYNRPIHRTAKKVAKIDEFGNTLKTWNSSNECAKEVGTAVKNVLQGKYEKHKGYKYIYI